MLSPDRDERLRTILENLETVIKNLDPRPKDFVQQTMDRYEKYGSRILLSDKQFDWLENLHKEYCSHAPPLPPIDDDDNPNDPDNLDDEIPF